VKAAAFGFGGNWATASFTLNIKLIAKTPTSVMTAAVFPLLAGVTDFLL
jgi:hypothetical protein